MSNKIKAALLLTVVLMFVALNKGSSTPPKTVQQANFESWLTAFETDVRRSENPQMLIPAVRLSLSSEDQSAPFSFQISNNDSAESAERLVRLLDLLEEAQVFNTYRWEGDGSEKAKIVVDTGKETFRAHLPLPAGNLDVRVQTMLKLFQLYALNRSASSNQVAQAAPNQAAETEAGNE